MNLNKQQSNTSFYETFSDLIFATMAIFVLLMMIFIVQINLKIGLEEALLEIQKNQKIITEKELLLKKEKELVKQLKNHQKSFESYNFEIVIAVDITGSMQLELNQLSKTIELIGKILPEISQSAKIGIIAYRKDQNNRDVSRIFPMQTIRPKKHDKGKSYKKLLYFTKGLTAKPGSAPFEKTINKAISFFSNTNNFTGHQTLIILGDVGPYEDYYQDQKISPKNLQQEKHIISSITNWKEKSLNRNLLLLYSGRDEIKKTSGEQLKKYKQSQAFFQKIAKHLNSPTSYSEKVTDMLPIVLKTILD